MRRLTTVQGRRVVLAIAAALLLVTVSTALAITWGEVDEDNYYANVGAIMVQDDSGWWQVGSGTLIDPKIFLTAGHVTDYLEYLAETGGASNVCVTFKVDATDESGYINVADVVTHPQYGGPRSDTHDVGVLILEEAITDIVPATLAPVGLLDELKREKMLKKQPYFTVVGYGTTLYWPPPQFVAENQRQIAVSEYLGLLPAWLQLLQNHAAGSEGSAFGDSGGPVFWTDPDTGDTVLVALVSWGDAKCVATGTNYRIDLPDTYEFLDEMFETYGE